MAALIPCPIIDGGVIIGKSWGRSPFWSDLLLQPPKTKIAATIRAAILTKIFFISLTYEDSNLDRQNQNL